MRIIGEGGGESWPVWLTLQGFMGWFRSENLLRRMNDDELLPDPPPRVMTALQNEWDREALERANAYL
jgi:hypothetical protein